MAEPTVRAVGNAVYIEYPDPDKNASWGEASAETAQFVAEQIRAALAGAKMEGAKGAYQRMEPFLSIGAIPVANAHLKELGE